MKYLEFFVFKLIANLLLVNFVIFVLFPLLGIHFAFDESMNAVKIVGILLVLLSILLFSRKGSS